MLSQDREKLKDILKNYSSQEVARTFSELAIETASELSDEGLKDEAKDWVKFSVSLDDLISGRPFLV